MLEVIERDFVVSTESRIELLRNKDESVGYCLTDLLFLILSELNKRLEETERKLSNLE